MSATSALGVETKASLVQRFLTRIFHEVSTIHSVAGMMSEFIDFIRKDTLYPARRLPNSISPLPTGVVLNIREHLFDLALYPVPPI